MTVNKSMIELGNSLDGTIKNAVDSVKKLEGIPKAYQKFMVSGDFVWGNGQKVDISSYGNSSKELNNYIAQVSTLNKEQQKVVFSMTNFSDGQKEIITNTLNEISTGEKLNGIIAEQVLREKGFGEAAVKGLTSIYKLSDGAGNYGVALTSKVIPAMEGWINKHTELIDANELLKNNIITGTAGNYKFSDSFIQLISNEQNAVVVTKTLTATQKAWNIATQFSKQLLLSLGVAAVAFIATKIVDYLMNLKTHSEELVDAMNDSHDAAQQATKDVEEIQSKIDDLNKSLKDAGVDKIEDIVDPAERERLQAINDMLQAQLELKKQLEKDANDKANADTSAVVNDKTEDSIVKTRTVNVSYAEGGANAGTHQVAEKVSKTESLNEHSDYLDQLVQKRHEMAAAGEEETQAYKDNEVEIEKEKTKIEELSSAVSEQMDGYETDADSFARYKDEYVTGTNAMTAATKALANANDKVGESASNYDVLLKKMQAAKNDIDNGNAERRDYRYMGAVDSLKQSGVTTGDDLSDLIHNPSKRTKEQTTAINILREAAKKAGVDIDSYVQALEVSGEFASKTAKETTKLSDAMTTLDNMQSGYQTCASAVDEYNKKGYVTMDTLQSLINLEPKYLKMLELKDGQLKINTQTAQTLTDANIQLARASLLADTLNNIKDTNNLKKAQSILGSVTEVVESATGALIGAQHQAASEAFESEGFESYAAVMDATSTMISNYETLDALFVKLGKQNPSKIWGKDSSATNKASKQASSALDAWSTLTSAMKEYNEQGYITFQTLKSLTSLEDKYSSMLKKNDVTGQLEMRTDDFYKLMKAELKEAQIKGDGASEAQYNKILEWTNRNIKNQTISYWDLVAAIEGYSAALSGAKEITDTFKDAWGNGKTVKGKQEKSRAGALDYEGTEAQSSALQDLMKYSEYDPELISKAFNKETGKIDLSGDMLKTAVTESLKQQAAAARTEGGAAAEAIATSYEKSAENIENDVISVQDYFDGLGSTIEEVNSKIDELQSAYTDLEDTTSEYNTYGGLSVDSLQKLLTMSPEYLACLEMNGDQLVFNRDKMQKLLILQLESRKEFLASKKETEDQAQIIQAIIDSIRTNGVNAIKGMGTEAERVKSILSDMKDIFSSFLDLIESANSKKDDDLKLWGEAMTEDIDKRIDALNKQKEALQEANDEEERAITLAKLKAELEKARTQRTVRKLTSNGYEWVADESAVKEAQDNLNDQQREWRKEDAEKAIDDQIDKLNELKDKYSEIISLIGTDWDDYNKKLKYASEIADMTFTEMEGRVDVFKDNVLASMQAANPISTIKNIISGLESLISTLEKVGNVLDRLDGGSGNGGITTLWNKITNLFNGKNTNNTQTAFGNFWNNLSQVGRNGVNKLQNVIFGGWNKITSGTSGFLSNVGNFFGEA